MALMTAEQVREFQKTIQQTFDTQVENIIEEICNKIKTSLEESPDTINMLCYLHRSNQPKSQKQEQMLFTRLEYYGYKAEAYRSEDGSLLGVNISWTAENKEKES